MEVGVFIPIGNNGWLLSENAPQYKPTFELNKQITLAAEKYGFDFALSMIKLRGFGGKTEFWDYNLESFTLMAGLAAVTSKIKLFGTTATLAWQPPSTPFRAVVSGSTSLLAGSGRNTARWVCGRAMIISAIDTNI
jgi:alkanesulfonate monooxygenase SsuD/methylene tetrahydromethanopterin reductase-like flavin-dependent oxidoreductase (luciferase family)